MSSFGTFLDPLADKVMMTVMFTTLSMANIVPGKLSYYIEMKKMYTQLLTIHLREAYSNYLDLVMYKIITCLLGKEEY